MSQNMTTGSATTEIVHVGVHYTRDGTGSAVLTRDPTRPVTN